MRVSNSVSCWVLLIALSMIHLSLTQDTYDGHYDLRARDAAYLCTLMDEYLKTGKQPNLSKTKPESIKRETFMKDKPCWKFAWVPCDPASYQASTQRPCGWYQMQKAPDGECK